jgi:uncharacterized membrane protein
MLWGLVCLVLFVSVLPHEAPASERALRFAETLQQRGISPLFVSGLISMIPVFELRGGIPVGIALFDLNPVRVYLVCVLFNLIPVLPILFFLNPIMKLLVHRGLFPRFFRFLEARVSKRKKLIDTYKEFGLFLFVAVPLPITGAWTGSLLAAIMRLSILPSFLFIGLGVLGAGVIVTILTMLGVYGLVGASLILLAAITLYIFRMKKAFSGKN